MWRIKSVRISVGKYFAFSERQSRPWKSLRHYSASSVCRKLWTLHRGSQLPRRGSDRRETAIAQTSSELKVVRSHSCVLSVSLPRPRRRFYSPPDTLPSPDLQSDRYSIPYRIMSFHDALYVSWKSGGETRFTKLRCLVGKLAPLFTLTRM